MAQLITVKWSSSDYVLADFELRSVDYGRQSSGDVARGTGFSGRGMDVSATSMYQDLEPLAPNPEVRFAPRI
jgi:hypothetical protein